MDPSGKNMIWIGWDRIRNNENKVMLSKRMY